LHHPGIHRRSDELFQLVVALNFPHFFYSGGWPFLNWIKRFSMGVWHLSDPQVRAAIMGGYVGR
jgi:hypothetical protein